MSFYDKKNKKRSVKAARRGCDRTREPARRQRRRPAKVKCEQVRLEKTMRRISSPILHPFHSISCTDECETQTRRAAATQCLGCGTFCGSPAERRGNKTKGTLSVGGAPHSICSNFRKCHMEFGGERGRFGYMTYASDVTLFVF